MEAETSAALVAWVRALGLGRLVKELSDNEQQVWTDELVRALEQLRVGAVISLGGTTRLVLARCSDEAPKPSDISSSGGPSTSR